MGSFTVIVPTLNEEGNIDSLLERIFQVREKHALGLSVLFVDSASSDRTCEKVQNWEGQYPVRLLCRNYNLGLAQAVVEGARHADTKYLVVMDADLSHPPETIPQLISPVLEGSCDMVIGSRYVEGGSLVGWPVRRRFSSRAATLPALLFCKVKDPLAGYFSVTRELLISLPGEVPGFKIALALLAEHRNWLRVREIPIEFRERHMGDSKMSRKVILDYARQLLQLTSRRLRYRD